MTTPPRRPGNQHQVNRNRHNRGDDFGDDLGDDLGDDAACIGQPADPAAPRSDQFDDPEAVASLTEVLRVVGKATFSPDLLGPRPGLWPFGVKARTRRTRRAAVTELARTRRAELRGMLTPPRPSAPSTPWRPVSRGRNALVIGGLVLVVTAVLGTGWWLSGTARRSGTAPVAATSPVAAPPTLTAETPTPDTSAPAVPTPAASALPLLPPIPSGGVPAIAPPSPTSIDPASVATVPVPAGPPSAADLASPVSAVVAWEARACPFDFHDAFGADQARAQPAMTAAGWASLDPSRVAADRDSWARTVAAQEVGACSAPVAEIDPEAPRSVTSAVVIVTADRVVTGASETSYVERVRDERVVVLGPDHRWLVDVATQGG